ncbi:hypothetical protein COCC4DRAFT_29186, partial [Bipolaris maydis ATCC 48331]
MHMQGPERHTSSTVKPCGWVLAQIYQKNDKGAQPNPRPIRGTNQNVDNLVKINATNIRRLLLRENAKRGTIKTRKRKKRPQKRHCIAYMGRKLAAESSGQSQSRNLV